jgi:Tol biopolymer transport system component
MRILLRLTAFIVGSTLLVAVLTLSSRPEDLTLSYLYYSSNPAGNWDVYRQLISTGGPLGPPERLTSHPARDFFIELAPGRQGWLLNSERDEPGQGDLYLANAGAEHLRPSARLPDRQIFQAWTPDGQAFITRSNHDGGQDDLYRVSLDGAKLTRLTDEPDINYVHDFDPTGDLLYSRINVQSMDVESVLYRVDLAGGPPQALNISLARSQVVLVGQRTGWIYYSNRVEMEDGSTGYDIFRMKADGSQRQNLTGDAAEEFLYALSPDEEWLFFTRVDGTVQASVIYRLHLATGKVQRLTRQGEEVVKAEGISADGRWLFYAVRHDVVRRSLADPHGPGPAQSIADSLNTPVFIASSPAGDWLLLRGLDFHDRGDFFLARLDGSQLQPITHNPAQEFFGAWYPLPDQTIHEDWLGAGGLLLLLLGIGFRRRD